jgi:hypothetical protein
MVMGQYSQWLYHREVDQQLRERLELIEQELLALQEQAAQLEDAICNENPILQAIAMQQSAEALLEDASPGSSTQKLPIAHTDTKKSSAKSVSLALFAWSNLPNLDTQEMELATIEPGRQQTEAIQQTATPYPEVNLLPTDMATFIDAHEQTMPQIQIPNWLRKAALNTNTPDRQKSGPDERTNTSIQRWLERWGKQVPDSQGSQEAQKNE